MFLYFYLSTVFEYFLYHCPKTTSYQHKNFLIKNASCFFFQIGVYFCNSNVYNYMVNRNVNTDYLFFNNVFDWFADSRSNWAALAKEDRQSKIMKNLNWPAEYFDRALQGPGSDSTLPQPAAPGQPDDLWVRWQYRHADNSGYCWSVFRSGRSGPNLNKNNRLLIKRFLNVLWEVNHPVSNLPYQWRLLSFHQTWLPAGSSGWWAPAAGWKRVSLQHWVEHTCSPESLLPGNHKFWSWDKTQGDVERWDHPG